MASASHHLALCCLKSYILSYKVLHAWLFLVSKLLGLSPAPQHIKGGSRYRMPLEFISLGFVLKKPLSAVIVFRRNTIENVCHCFKVVSGKCDV